MTATLYIIATPIGNLDDISRRAIDTLHNVDCIAAEDPRHSAKLMQHFAIQTPMLTYHEHSGELQTEKVLKLLSQGKSVALISDAGTPLISDPGYRLVKDAHAANISVVPVPGACALIAALSASGLATNRFGFEGFLPNKQKARMDTLKSLSTDQRTLIFYEAPHRIVACLEDMLTVFGEKRRVSLARELSKTYETIKQLAVGEMLQWVQADDNQQRGEIVLLVDGAEEEKPTNMLPEAIALVGLLVNELPPKLVSKIVAEHYHIPKKIVYEYVLSLKT